jgi:hypothetical protein
VPRRVQFNVSRPTVADAKGAAQGHAQRSGKGGTVGDFCLGFSPSALIVLRARVPG